MKLFTKKKKAGWLAISPSEQGTCVAHVYSHGNSKPTIQLAALETESLKKDNDCKILTANLHLERYHCSLLLHSGEYQLIQIEKPSVPTEELNRPQVGN